MKTHISESSATINLHTTSQIGDAIAQQLNQHAALRKQLQLLTSASNEYSKNMASIFSALHPEPAEGSMNPDGLPTRDIVYE